MRRLVSLAWLAGSRVLQDKGSVLRLQYEQRGARVWPQLSATPAECHACCQSPGPGKRPRGCPGWSLSTLVVAVGASDTTMVRGEGWRLHEQHGRPLSGAWGGAGRAIAPLEAVQGGRRGLKPPPLVNHASTLPAGERSQDQEGLLQGQGVPQAHHAQGHPVQDRQGVALRPGCGGRRQRDGSGGPRSDQTCAAAGCVLDQQQGSWQNSVAAEL